MSLLNFSGESNYRQGEKKTLRLLFGIGALVGTIALGSTLAASINLNGGGPVEFGQGVTQTTSCDSEILVTPYSSFVNGNPGEFMFTSLRLEGVDTTSGSGSDEGCAGKTFTIKLYEEEGNQFPPSYEISVDSEGVFSSPSGDTDGALEGDENSSVTLTFDESLIDAELVYRITIESSSTQASPASYEVGDIGPGGGKIFYVDANGFNCGPLFNETGSPTQEKCNYLEAAPTTGINAWTDAVFEWSGNTGDLIDTTSESIGSGYQNSNQMIQQSPSGDTPGRAATISRAYRGPNDKEDWYLPSSNELNELLLQRTTVGATEDYYWWSSTESGSIAALIRALNGDLSASLKNQILFVRPIRAF